MQTKEKIDAFIKEHHVMSLATHSLEELSVCSLFYAYEKEKSLFVVASSEETRHISHLKTHAEVAGNILLETHEVGKIQGLQFQARMSEVKDKELKKLYYKAFPYALALRPKLWCIDVKSFKFTDNRLGFGKKLIWP
jgi:uncharacterized protein YhbP (UPF0306 family)